jgi:uncharacterized MnhB-related membrane protein
VRDDSEGVAATVSTRKPSSAAGVRAIIGALIVEKHRLLKANDPAAAEAIGLAIDYWQTVLSRDFSG